MHAKMGAREGLWLCPRADQQDLHQQGGVSLHTGADNP